MNILFRFIKGQTWKVLYGKQPTPDQNLGKIKG